jgi:hypothetical protein
MVEADGGEVPEQVGQGGRSDAVKWVDGLAVLVYPMQYRIPAIPLLSRLAV